MRIIRAFLPILLYTAVIGLIFWMIMLAFLKGWGG